MKTLESFKKETLFYTALADFVIYEKEWKQFEIETKAICVKMFDFTGNNVLNTFVLKGLKNTGEVLQNMQDMPPGFYCHTNEVIRN